MVSITLGEKKKKRTIKTSQSTKSKKDLCFSYITEANAKSYGPRSISPLYLQSRWRIQVCSQHEFPVRDLQIFLFSKKVKVENKGKCFTIETLLVGGFKKEARIQLKWKETRQSD